MSCRAFRGTLGLLLLGYSAAFPVARTVVRQQEHLGPHPPETSREPTPRQAADEEHEFVPRFAHGAVLAVDEGVHPEAHVFSFEAYGVTFDLNATKNHHLFASDYSESVRRPDGTFEAVPSHRLASAPHRRCHYIATITGDPNGWAAFSSCDGDGLRGRVFAHGRDLSIEPARRPPDVTSAASLGRKRRSLAVLHVASPHLDPAKTTQPPIIHVHTSSTAEEEEEPSSAHVHSTSTLAPTEPEATEAAEAAAATPAREGYSEGAVRARSSTANGSSTDPSTPLFVGTLVVNDAARCAQYGHNYEAVSEASAAVFNIVIAAYKSTQWYDGVRVWPVLVAQSFQSTVTTHRGSNPRHQPSAAC